MFEIEINEQKVQAAPGEMIISAADRHGIYIPRFCYHKKLSIAANCRMCLVEVAGVKKTLPACATPVAENMKVYTQSKAAIDSQRKVMEFLLINHPLDCPICDQGGECELQDLAMGYGEGYSHFIEGKRVVKDKDIGPLISTELTRCIQCTRCVRFGEEIAGLRELGMINRGEKSAIATFLGEAVKSEMSGNVIDVCPVGALTNKPFRFQARAWEMRQHEAIAPHDCIGSNLFVHTTAGIYRAERKVMRTVPRENEAINETWLADRDRYSYEGLHSDERLHKPMIKRDGHWQETDWQTALDFVVDKLKGVRAKHGADKLAALISPNSTIEEHYLLQKLWRGLGSQHIDHRLRQADFRDQAQLDLFPQLGCGIAQLENLDAALLIGADIRREQPIASIRLRKAALKGKPIFCVNPVDYAFNFAVSHKIIAGDAEFVRAVAEVVKALANSSGKSLTADWQKLLKDLKPSVEATAIAEGILKAEKAAIILGAYGNYFPQSSIVRSLVKLMAEFSGATVGYLTAGANEAGAWLAGSLPHRLPGGVAVKQAGYHVNDMFAEKLLAYLLVNIEPEFDCAHSSAALAALSNAELVVMLTPFISKSMRDYADVLLPITPFTENEGHFVNINGVWQANKLINPLAGEARPAWKVLRVLGNLLEITGFDYTQLEQITAELKQLLAEIPKPKVQAYLPSTLNLSSAKLHRLGEWPMYRVDSLVRRADALQQMANLDFSGIRLHPKLARELQINDGDEVVVKQGNAQITLPVKLDQAIALQQIVLPMAIPATAGFGSAFAEIELQRSSQRG